MHITHRGIDRYPAFFEDVDFAYFRWALKEAATAARCAVHAYALMSNHVHLLVTPEDAEGPARMMKRLGGRYVRYFNDRFGRTGTLWDGRYRSVIVSYERYFFACCRYIELNPVRARLVSDVAAYEWSSYRRNALGAADELVTSHPAYVSLGSNARSRCDAYRTMFASEVEPSSLAALVVAPTARPVLQRSLYSHLVETSRA